MRIVGEKRDKVDREKKRSKRRKKKKRRGWSVWNFLLRTQHGRTSGTDSAGWNRNKKYMGNKKSNEVSGRLNQTVEVNGHVRNQKTWWQWCFWGWMMALWLQLYSWGCRRKTKRRGSKFLFGIEFALDNNNGLSFWFLFLGFISCSRSFLGKWRNGGYIKYGVYRSASTPNNNSIPSKPRSDQFPLDIYRQFQCWCITISRIVWKIISSRAFSSR